MAEEDKKAGVRRLSKKVIVGPLVLGGLLCVTVLFAIMQSDAERKAAADKKVVEQEAHPDGGADPTHLIQAAPHATEIPAYVAATDATAANEPAPGLNQAGQGTAGVTGSSLQAAPGLPARVETLDEKTADQEVQKLVLMTAQSKLSRAQAYVKSIEANMEADKAASGVVSSFSQGGFTPGAATLSRVSAVGGAGNEAGFGAQPNSLTAALAAVSAAKLANASANQNALPAKEDPTGQTEKNAFFNQKPAPEDDLPYTRVRPSTPYTILAGSHIRGALDGEINSDLPGDAHGHVVDDVYDTATGKYLLIPAGSRLLGKYDSNVTYGQDTVAVAWNRVTFPDGTYLNLGGMSGTDQSGQSGFRDETYNHYGRIFGSALLMSGFSAVAQLSQPQAANGQNYSPSQVATGAMGQQLTQAGIAITQKNLGIAPTQHIRVGYPFTISVRQNIVFNAPFIDKSELEHQRDNTEVPVQRFLVETNSTRRVLPDHVHLHGSLLPGWTVLGAGPGFAQIGPTGSRQSDAIETGMVHPILGNIEDIFEVGDTGRWVIQGSRGYLIGEQSE